MNKVRVSPRLFAKMVKNKKDLLSSGRGKINRRSLVHNKNLASKNGANVKVLIRVRPPNDKELASNQK